ncbi:hypothetical protein [Planktothrix pseudagardhii]|uniref:hypothetical protein n=1 Tax=Planktothrix pseudagardhii TaxID=132604 RepID=UPI0020B2DD0E|nr:hypothetical protein [Planktothrix pseudagardhii]
MSSQTNHPYHEWIAQIQEKIFLAVSIGLLNRLAKEQENIIDKKLEIILRENKVWNNIKTIKEFDNKKEISDPLVNSTRKLLLFRKLASSFSKIANPFTESELVIDILNKIPDDTTSVVLEELLDRFMEEEQYKLSPHQDNPFIKQVAQVRTIDEFFAEIPEIADEAKYYADRVDEGIQSIQLQKQKTVFISNNINQDNSEESLKTIDSQFREYIHPVLQSLYGERKLKLENPTKKYIVLLENQPEILLYIDRPIYKIALRVRNILIFDYIDKNPSFSKEGISSIFDFFKKTLTENLEIHLFLSFIEKVDNKQKHMQKIVYKIVCKIYNTIINKDIDKTINLPKNIEPGSREYIDILKNTYIDFLRNNIQYLDDYREISIDSLPISIDDIFNQFSQVLALKCIGSLAHIRKNLSDIFLDVAKQIAFKQKAELESAKKNFENNFFENNSSNILIEVSRHFLAGTSFLFDDFSNAVNELFKKQDFNNEICLSLDEKFMMDYSWSILFPVVGINVIKNSHQALFHDLADSLSEIYEIKFISPEILKFISMEATSSVEGGPIIIEFKNATACASFKGIKAGDSLQALKIAITKLTDAMETQWFLTNHGHQYKVEPLVEQSLVRAFCKKEFNNTFANSNSGWVIQPLLLKRGRTCNYTLSEETRKYLEIPSRLVKILIDRTKSGDVLGRLALNIVHCIKLFRQGYFSERLSERFRLYWTVIEILFSTEAVSSKNIKIKQVVPYRVSLFELGIENLLEPGTKYQYKQARIWIREDIEDLYTFVRNPLIHDGVEHTPAYERLMNRFENIVSSILRELVIIVIYKTLPDDFLEKGIEGIIEYMEMQQPSLDYIPIL